MYKTKCIYFSDTIQLVKDNTYGIQDTTNDERWNGIVGELIRKVREMCLQKNLKKNFWQNFINTFV